MYGSTDDIQDLRAEVNEALRIVRDLANKRLSLDGARLWLKKEYRNSCLDCGASIDRKKKNCGNCGSPIEKQEEIIQLTPGTCTKCGDTDEHGRYCTGCGEPMIR